MKIPIKITDFDPLVVAGIFAAAFFMTMTNIAVGQIKVVGESKLLLNSDIRSLDRQIEPNRMVILDYSGSMNNKLAAGDRQLYQLARKAADKLVRGSSRIDANAKTGLIVFGNKYRSALHPSMKGKSITITEAQRIKSCSDINVELNYGKFTPAANVRLTNAINNLDIPLGETPVIAAIRKAAELMVSDGSIILITDFERRTCSDPKISLCERYKNIATELTGRRLFLTHVVAMEREPRLGESPNNRANILAEIKKFAQCSFAEPKYIQIDDVMPVVNEIESELKEARKPAIVKATVSFDRNPALIPKFGSAAMPSYFLINTSQDDDRSQEFVGGVSTIELAPGGARIVAVVGNQTLGDGKIFNAVRSQTRELAFQVKTVAATFDLVDLEGRKIAANTPVKWTLNIDNKYREIDGKAEQKFNLLTLPHIIRAQIDERQAKLTITPDLAGGDQNFTLRIGSGLGPVVTSSLRYDQESKFSRSKLASKVVLTDNKTKQTYQITDWENGSISVLEGTYSIAVVSAYGRVDLGDITVRENDRLSISGIIPMPQLAASLVNPSDSTRWVLTSADGEQQEFQGAELLQPLPPGKYTLEAHLVAGSRKRDIEMMLGGDPLEIKLDIR